MSSFMMHLIDKNNIADVTIYDALIICGKAL